MSIINISPEEPKDDAFQNIENILDEKASEATLQQVKTELTNVKQSATETKTQVSAIKTETAGIKTEVTAMNGKIGAKEDAANANTLFGKLKSVGESLAAHIASWNTTRAGKIDHLDAAMSSRAPANTALSTATWTSARASAIDAINTNANNASSRAENARVAAVNAQNNTATNNTANKTGILSQKVSYTHNLLENGTYGLNAMKTAVDTIHTNAANSSSRAENARVAAVNAQNNTAANNTANKTGLLSQKLSYTHSLLENGTYGLNAIKNVINTINTNAARGTVKSVQRGVADIRWNTSSSNQFGYVDVILSPSVNANKTLAFSGLVTEYFNIGAGNSENIVSGAVIQNSNTIRVYMTPATNGRLYYVPWQVVEYY